ELCEEKLDFCAPELNPCQHDSKCILTPQGYKCECTPGYVGEHCELDFDDCEENKCQNGGHCIDAVNGYTCICPEGYSGLFCEFTPPMVLPRTSPCDNHDCLNGAQCVAVGTDLRCQCLHGYEGEHLNDGSFHSVDLVAADQTLSLSIDGGPPKSISSISKQSTLNIDSPLYLGGRDSRYVYV
ncbi:hypothetical protein XENOCAPTIV_023277, partial [Xenoophorus captivus]